MHLLPFYGNVAAEEKVHTISQASQNDLQFQLLEYRSKRSTSELPYLFFLRQKDSHETRSPLSEKKSRQQNQLP